MSSIQRKLRKEREEKEEREREREREREKERDQRGLLRERRGESQSQPSHDSQHNRSKKGKKMYFGFQT
jgi:hypothetical protein